MKRLWLSACALTRPNRRLSELTSGLTSSGEALASMELRSRGERRSTASRRSSRGLSARLTAQLTANAAAVTSTRLGSSTLSRMERAHCWRGSDPSASATTTSPSTVCWRWRTIRQVTPPFSSLWNSGSGVVGTHPASQGSPRSTFPSASADDEGGMSRCVVQELLDRGRKHQHRWVGPAQAASPMMESASSGTRACSR